MFSPVGGPKEDKNSNIDWLGDLKFFIDTNDKLLENYIFPMIKKHKEYLGNPNVYKLYVKPLEKCLDVYCDQFKIDDRAEKFSKEGLIELAKEIATSQENFIKNGDYK